MSLATGVTSRAKYTALTGDPSTAEGLLAALSSAQLVAGRATYFARLVTPVAKLIQRARGNGRVSATAESARADLRRREP
jgi:hypothetical protein